MRSCLEGTKAEYIMVELFPLNGTKLMLCILNRPQNTVADPLLELRTNLDKLNESCKLLIVGDFNLAHVNWSREYPMPIIHNNLHELFCEMEADYFLSQMAVGPIHANGNKLDFSVTRPISYQM